MTTTTLLPVLKQGMLAFFDSMSGPIPCKIETITSDRPADMRPASFQEVTATVTAQTRCYKKGDKLQGWGLDFFPREALRRSRFSSYIRPYQVQA